MGAKRLGFIYMCCPRSQSGDSVQGTKGHFPEIITPHKPEIMAFKCQDGVLIVVME